MTLASLICMEPPIGCGLTRSSQMYGILTGTSEKYPHRPCASHGQLRLAGPADASGMQNAQLMGGVQGIRMRNGKGESLDKRVEGTGHAPLHPALSSD